MSDEAGQPLRIAVLAPVYNDWVCADHLVKELADTVRRQSSGRPAALEIVLVDDGSLAPGPDDLATGTADAIASARIVRLERNVGHQRAICIGLCYIAEHVPCDLLVVMDSDGEDRPEDIWPLIDAAQRGHFAQIVFAARARRSEGSVFRLGYWSYRLLHRALTGIPVRFGNFSAVPAEMLHRLPLVPEMWNHYAAAVLKSRLPYVSTPIRRGTRFHGKSSMNITSLTMHGVSAMSVFAELVSVRLMTMAGLTGLVLLGCSAGILWLNGYGMSWVLLAAVALAGFGTPMLLMLGIFMLAIHAFRGTASFLPKRDYRLFVRSVTPLHTGSEREAPPAPFATAAKEPA